MDEYKKVNRELIEKVQEMRIDLGVYRQELTKLRLCVLEEQQKRVDQKQRSTELVARYFCELLQEMAPGTNMLKLLGVDEESVKPRKHDHERSRSKRRSNIDILQELRRSSESARRFSGIIAVSPTRRMSGSVSSPSPVESAEMVMEECEVEDDVESDEATLGATASSQLKLIVEDEEDPSIELRSSKESSVADDQENQNDTSVIEEDLTIENISEVTGNSIELRDCKRRNASVLQPATKHLRDVTNTSQQHINEKSPQPSSPHLIMRRGKPRNNSHSAEVVEGAMMDQRNDEQEESIPVARCARVGVSTFERLPEDASHSMMGDLSIGNFVDALTSTPFNFKSDSNKNENSTRRRSLRRSAQNNNGSPSACESVSSTLRATTDASEAAANISRPRRKCAPSNLVEPQLRTKMRDESNDRKGCKNSKERVEKKRKK